MRATTKSATTMRSEWEAQRGAQVSPSHCSVKYLWVSVGIRTSNLAGTPIIHAHVGESRPACNPICANSARRSGVARMYDQAGGAREMAHEAHLPARFEPLLE